jgi:lysophospholipase L1-like esterase
MVRVWQATVLVTALGAGLTGAGPAPAATGPSAENPVENPASGPTSPPVATPDSGNRFVALGDSYASGVGAGDYLPDSGACLRSMVGYPQGLVAVRTDLILDNRSCAGATTADVLVDQVVALGTDTRLVTLTVGGNDAGFSQTMGACVVGGEQACLDAVREGESFARSQLPALLTEVFTAVRTGAPGAVVYVLGYPHIFETGPTCPDSPLGHRSRAAVNRGSDTLDAVLAEAASDHGFVFVDVRETFDGHGVCSADPWVTGVTDPGYESFHPNAAGQRNGYRDALLQVLGDGPEPGTGAH